MKYRLTGASACVNYGAIATFSIALVVSDARADAKQVAQQRLISLRSIIQRLEMLAGDYQYMQWRLRIDVAQHDTTIVALNNFTL